MRYIYIGFVCILFYLYLFIYFYFIYILPCLWFILMPDTTVVFTNRMALVGEIMDGAVDS